MLKESNAWRIRWLILLVLAMLIAATVLSWCWSEGVLVGPHSFEGHEVSEFAERYGQHYAMQEGASRHFHSERGFVGGGGEVAEGEEVFREYAWNIYGARYYVYCRRVDDEWVIFQVYKD